MRPDEPTRVNFGYKCIFQGDAREVTSTLASTLATAQLLLHPEIRRPNLSQKQWRMANILLATFQKRISLRASASVSQGMFELHPRSFDNHLNLVIFVLQERLWGWHPKPASKV